MNAQMYIPRREKDVQYSPDYVRICSGGVLLNKTGCFLDNIGWGCRAVGGGF